MVISTMRPLNLLKIFSEAQCSNNKKFNQKYAIILQQKKRKRKKIISSWISLHTAYPITNLFFFFSFFFFSSSSKIQPQISLSCIIDA